MDYFSITARMSRAERTRYIADLYIHRYANAIIEAAWADCNNCAFLWLLFRCIWDNET